jgi:NHLM bacteriocin system ABC transporter ATP-binding protein
MSATAGRATESAIVAASASQAWRVNGTEVVVFVVETDAAGAPRGRRSYLGAVPGGEVVFGGSPRGTPTHALLLVAPPGRLEPVALDALSVADRDAAVVRFLALILGESAERGERSRATAIAPKRGSVDVAAGTRVIASSQVVYVRLSAGAARFCGTDVAIGAIVPLTPLHALEALEAVRIEALGRPEDVATPQVAEALRSATDAMWARWFAADAAEDERRRERQRATRERDTRALDVALTEAASIFQTHAPPLAGDEDAIVATARIVGRASGVTIEAPAEHFSESEAMVRAIAEASRVPIRRVALRARWWRREGGPLLAFSGDAPVALLPARGGSRYELVDPRRPGHVVLVDDDLAAQIEPVGYLFVRTFPPRAISIGDIVRIAAPGNGGDLWRILAFGFVAGVLGAVTPLAVGAVYGLIIPNGLRGSLGLVAVGLVLVGVTATIVEIVRNLLVLRLQTRTSGTAQAAVMARLVNLPATFFRNYAVGDLADRALAVDAIQRYVTGTTLSVTLSAVFSLTGFAVIVAYDPRLALVCAALAAIAVAVSLAEAFITLPLYRDLSTRGGAISAHVLQLIAGIAKLRVSRAEPRAFVGWLEQFIAMRRLSTSAGTIGYRFGIFQSLWPAVAALAIVADVALFRAETISAAAFLAISAAFGQLLGALLGLGDALSSIVRVVPIYERAKPLLDAIPEIHDGHGDPGRMSGDIVLRRVAFSYQNGRRILDEIDLAIPRGEFVAIVGPSGSGKSTLFRLLLGFEQPEEGAILYDGHDLSSLDLGAVRRQIGCVLQTAKTIPGSIFENIACGTILTREEAWEAARAVGLAGDIAALPMGMETMIGDDGGGLSGGQRQRIIIARALAHKPRIILFDEATSALDNQTQSIVTQSLRDMRATRVVIAHRLSTIVDADRIVVLDHGRIVQSGAYADLVGIPGPFAELAARQRL